MWRDSEGAGLGAKYTESKSQVLQSWTAALGKSGSLLASGCSLVQWRQTAALSRNLINEKGTHVTVRLGAEQGES